MLYFRIIKILLQEQTFILQETIKKNKTQSINWIKVPVFLHTHTQTPEKIIILKGNNLSLVIFPKKEKKRQTYFPVAK